MSIHMGGMAWYDWLIVIIPTAFVYWVGIYTRRYLRDVSAFLSAGRVCGRYVISVGDIAAGLSVTGLMAYIEVHYRTGFATAFWSAVLTPLGVLLGLYGFVTYRFRETKSQSIGQFLEMRYSRKFRIFAAALRSISEMLANMITPALAARFFIYFLGWPKYFEVCGIQISTFHALMIVILVLAISIICMGGSMAIIITDTVQGFICYPMLVFFTIFILVKFDWTTQMLPVLADRVEGESFLNPNDIKNLRDFNLFSLLLLPVVVTLLHRASWIGAGSSSTAARSPHEQKMASLLGSWRAALGGIFYVLVAVAVLTLLNHDSFAKQAHEIRLQLTDKVASEMISDPAMRSRVMSDIKSLPVQVMPKDHKLSEKDNLDTRYLNLAHNQLKRIALEDVKKGNKAPANAEEAKAQQIDNEVAAEAIANPIFAQFRTLYYQQLLPITLRNMLPNGMLGLFCLMMVMLMISTDDSRIFSAAITVSQDVVLPLCKKKLTPREHMWMVRIVTISIGVFFFLGSSFMAQLDYINLFVTLMTTMWMGGCGPVLMFGLYSRFGTTAGAWTSLLTGMFMGFIGMFFQRSWADIVYPFLHKHDLVGVVGKALETMSGPFEPWIEWRMNEVRCPINSYEWYFITMMITLLLYIVVSKLTCKEPFNLDRMLHRGKYDLEGKGNVKPEISWKKLHNMLLGITPEYTNGDKFIAWSYFIYSFVYRFGVTFVVVVIWNLISPWPTAYWGIYFFIVFLLVPGVMAAITAVWFGIGGAIDLRRMFYDLAHREINTLDDGRVEGNMSLADKAQLEAIDKDKASEKASDK